MNFEYIAAIQRNAKINFLVVRLLFTPTDRVRVDLIEPVTDAIQFESEWYAMEELERMHDDVETFCESYETSTNTPEPAES